MTARVVRRPHVIAQYPIEQQGGNVSDLLHPLFPFPQAKGVPPTKASKEGLLHSCLLPLHLLPYHFRKEVRIKLYFTLLYCTVL